MVKDTATVVKLNGMQLSNLVKKRYYQFESNTADYIEADQPVLVAQYMSSSGGYCSGSSTTNDGDPEIFYLSPIEQAINKAGFYRNNLFAITANYLTLIIPNGGLATLKIDNSQVFDYTYPHSRPGYSAALREIGRLRPGETKIIRRYLRTNR